MGLDMYLREKVYIGANYEHNNVQGVINLTQNGKMIDIPLKRVSIIELEAGHWRKANQIHKWFVDNVQGGKDDCGDYYVSKDKLQELLSTCKDVLKTKDTSKLPPQAGFFFGGTEIDEYYFEDIKQTIEILDGLNLKTNENSFYYHSSW